MPGIRSAFAESVSGRASRPVRAGLSEGAAKEAVQWLLASMHSVGHRTTMAKFLGCLFPLCWIIGLGPISSCSQNRATDQGQVLPLPLRDGIMLLQHKSYAEARRKFVLATQLRPKSAKAFFYLGTTELHLGNLPAAEKSLRRAMELDPTAPSTILNLGMVLLETQKTAEAVL
jgi:tetratricopeptide (TPR) repeat protein